MQEWGRKTYAKWPSRKPLWTWAALFAAILLFAGTTVSQYSHTWGFAQKLYLGSYLKSGVRSAASATARGRYELLEGVTSKGQLRFILGDEAEKEIQADGRTLYRLTREGTDHGLVGLRWYGGTFNDHLIHEFMSHWIYQDQGFWDHAQTPLYLSIFVFALGLCFAIPKDRARQLLYKHGADCVGLNWSRRQNLTKSWAYRVSSHCSCLTVFPSSTKNVLWSIGS